MKLSIKRIEAIDLGHLKKLYKEFLKEVPVEYPKWDNEATDKRLMDLLVNINNPLSIQLIAYDGKKPAGFFLGRVIRRDFGTPACVGLAQDIYVVPNKRSKFVGFKLIKAATREALQNGAEGFEAIGTHAGTDKRWERFGFKAHSTWLHMSIEDMISFTEGKRHESNSEVSY